MQKGNINRTAIKIAIILLNIVLIFSLFLVLLIKSDLGYSLYWGICPFLIVVVLLLIHTWSQLGLNADTKESRNIQRAFDEATTVSTVFFGLVYILIQGLKIWNEDITKESFMIVGFFIIIIIYQMIIYLAIYNARKETRTLLKKTNQNGK